MILFNSAYLIIICISIILASSKGNAALPAEDMPHRRKALLMLIAAGGVLIRLAGFGSMPAGVNQDGAMAAVDAMALAEYGTDRFGTWLPAHLYAWGFGQMSSLLSYLMVPWIWVFGLSTVTMRLPQLLASIMGAVFLYLFVRDAFGKRCALIAAAITAVNPWHFMQSRWAMDCNLLPHFFMGGLYFLNRGAQGRKSGFHISMVFFGLCMYSYGVALYSVPLLLLIAGAVLVKEKKISVRELLLCGTEYLLIAWPFLLTMAINAFGRETIELPFVTMQYFPDTIRTEHILFFSGDILSQLAENLRCLVSTVILQKKDMPFNDMRGFGSMYMFYLPLAAVGLIRLLLKKGSGKRLTAAGLLVGVWVGLVTWCVNINRVNIIFYFLIILTALGIEFIVERLKFAGAAAGILTVLAAAVMLSCYFGSYRDYAAAYGYEGFGEAFEEAKESGAERIYVTADAQAKGRWYVSEILTMFYDRTDALYFQGKSEHNHSEEALLPYSQRFVYMSINDSVPRRMSVESAAAVVMAKDIGFFDEDLFSVTRHGGFASVIRK